MGLKENVIIGKLIPAGAGLTAYSDFAKKIVPEVAVAAEETDEEVVEEGVEAVEAEETFEAEEV